MRELHYYTVNENFQIRGNNYYLFKTNSLCFTGDYLGPRTKFLSESGMDAWEN